MNFASYLCDGNGYKIPEYKGLCSAEKRHFRMLNENMTKKSTDRINTLKERISNDLLKKTFDKKYQVNSHIEYKILREYIDTLNSNYELLWVYDNKVHKNKLDKIYRGDYSCCRSCDSHMIFVNKNIPVIHCYLYKKSNNIK